MNDYSSRDLLNSLRNILDKLEKDPDHDRPRLAELKRILQERIAKLENPPSDEMDDWPAPPTKAEETP